MDKKAIAAAAITRWEEEDGNFVTTSSVLDCVLGAGDTEAESFADFLQDLELHYQAWRKGAHAILSPPQPKVGRPPTGRVALNAHLKPDIKEALNQLAKLHRKSKGEIIEILVAKVCRNEVAL